MPLLVESTSKKRVQIKITGVVQGVGFRPFVYQLAESLSLCGYVLNGGEGVLIQAQGEDKNLDKFINLLKDKAPVLSNIDTLTFTEINFSDETSFSIKHSFDGNISTMVSCDMSMCCECKEEMHDPSNRRYNYPFINCTNCGPRYSIIKNLPYDRDQTSMQDFKMCKACQKEYDNPLSRRFHAQPISCYECGPRMQLLSTESEYLEKNNDAILTACEKIRSGEIIAVKGLGGFHLICDARNEDTVKRLREKKNRPKKPFAVMFKSLDKVKEVSSLSPAEEELISSQESPIVIVDKNNSDYLSSSIAPNISRIGVFLPYTPLHEILLNNLNFPIVATSANLSDEPIIVDENKIIKKLSHVVTAILSHDREIINACDDSVYAIAKGKKLLMRLARGYAPLSMTLKRKSLKKIIAVGANQKSSLALAFDDHFILSPHIGELNSLEVFEYFERTLETFSRFYKFKPEVIVCDKHPLYETTKWAKRYVQTKPECELIEVQHHYAHALACMAEYKLEEKVLAFCFDGTGYGEDGTLWGGEVLIADVLEYKRVHYFSPLPLMGGEKAVKEPRRMALSLLFESYSFEEVQKMQIPCVQSFSKEELKILYTMYTKQLNAPLSSSVGRIFDAVLSLSGAHQSISYEGESGLLLECSAEKVQTQDAFSYKIEDKIINYKTMTKEVLKEKDQNIIALKFINMLSKIIIEISDLYPELEVILSGGVFQNRLLVSLVSEALDKKQRVYYLQEKTPINDGGIALGQLYHAYHLHKEKDEK